MPVEDGEMCPFFEGGGVAGELANCVLRVVRDTDDVPDRVVAVRQALEPSGSCAGDGAGGHEGREPEGVGFVIGQGVGWACPRRKTGGVALLRARGRAARSAEDRGLNPAHRSRTEELIFTAEYRPAVVQSRRGPRGGSTKH